ncbi:MAG TPA: arylsulfatase [Polyangiaceae bacterium]|nr:arylsulfatase [Polyangiaceae bacterium]
MPLPRDIPNRETLPIPDRNYAGPVWYDAAQPPPGAEFPPVEPIRPPEGAPNVLIVLIDDVGFGATSAFGGPIATPTAEGLAAKGLKYTRFHTTALCAPTRAALLTGHNHHSVGMGTITETATAAPGNNSMIPNSAASIAKILRYNGYSTAHFGKCHEVPVWETGATGPFDHWPTYQGFEKFYGFVSGETDQFSPVLYDGTTHIALPEEPGYHLTEDLANQAIRWLETQHSLAPGKPFFMYFAPGATHAPHQVPDSWIKNYDGQFTEGWDALREATFEKQKALGVIPPDAILTPRDKEMLAWDNPFFDGARDVLTREMQVYAAFLEHTDYQVGRVIDKLTALGLLENTIVFYILGDNGASAEGTFLGTFNEMMNFNGIKFETPEKEKEFLNNNIESFGTKDAYCHYAVGWAHAMCTPYQWTKQVASHFGGTRNGMITHWPKGIPTTTMGMRSRLRDQFTHVIDVLPTVLEAANLPQPVSVDGVMQKTIEGTSFCYTFDEPNAADRHILQYFEMFGNRGIYSNGWTAVTRHSTPWQLAGEELKEFDEDIWELYYTYGPPIPELGISADWTQAVNLNPDTPGERPSDHPALVHAEELRRKLKDLQTLWLIEAARYQVFPLDDRRVFYSETNVVEKTYYDGMFVSDPRVINTFNCSSRITAQIEITESVEKLSGVVVARGNNFGGYGLYFHEGKLTYVYNYLGMEITKVQARDLLPSKEGSYTLRMEFTYDGLDANGVVNAAGKGGTVALFCDDAELATITTITDSKGNPLPVDKEGHVPHTNPVIFNTDAFLMVGAKNGAPLCNDLNEGDNRFTGKVHSATIKVTSPRAPVSPELQMLAAMAVQ